MTESIKSKPRIGKYLAYALLIGGITLILGGFLYFVFSPNMPGTTYKLGEKIVEILGLPKSIG